MPEPPSDGHPLDALGGRPVNCAADVPEDVTEQLVGFYQRHDPAALAGVPAPDDVVLE
jgi:hypothetical protein